MVEFEFVFKFEGNIEFERYLQEPKLDLNLAALLLSNHNTVFLQTIAYLFVVIIIAVVSKIKIQKVVTSSLK